MLDWRGGSITLLCWIGGKSEFLDCVRLEGRVNVCLGNGDLFGWIGGKGQLLDYVRLEGRVNCWVLLDWREG